MTRLIVAGTAVVDFVFLVDAIPAEARKYRARDAMIIGGGCAANAAVAITRLGGDAMLSAVLGSDEIAGLIVSGLEAERVDCSHVICVEGSRSSYSSVFVDRHGERQIMNFRDPAILDNPGVMPASGVSGFNAVLADTGRPAIATAAMRAARAYNVPGILDVEAPAAPSEGAISQASHVAFSAQGLSDYTGTDDLGTGLREAQQRTGAFVCVTDGRNGTYYLADSRLINAPAFEVNAVDTLGAGDVWHGAFALLLAEGQSEPEAIRFANAVAAIKCEREGGRAGYPSRAETEMKLREPIG